MDFADLNSLTEASEVFTPLKAQTAFEIAQDLDIEDDNIVKIPHGLTAKRNRRKSFHHESNKSEFLTASPQRMPLTAPRNNILNSKPMGSLEISKRSLINELQSLGGGKENSLFKDDAPSANSMHSPLKLEHKRRSSDVEGLEESNTSKLQKIEASINEFEDIEEDEEEFSKLENEILNSSFKNPTDIESDDEKDEDEELSRIEPFTEARATTSSSFLVTTENDAEREDDDEEAEVTQPQISNTSLIVESHLKPITPSRVTESIAISPKTEQNSRLVDESMLLLDTTKSPNVDDSFVTESPLLQHNHLVLEHPGNCILDNIDDLLLSPQKRSHLSTPNQRPFFTITQVHEIQAEFKNDAEKMEESIKQKSVKILELNDEINECKNKVFQLEDTIESLVLQKKQILKENELFKSEHGIFKGDIAKLETSLKAQDEKLAKQKYVINKFKEKVQELQFTITDKTNELLSLKEDFGAKSRAIESLQFRVNDFEHQAQKLTVNLKQEVSKSQESLEREKSLEAELLSIKDMLDTVLGEKTSLETQLSVSVKTSENKSELLDVSTKENEDAKNYILGLEADIESKSSEIESKSSEIEHLGIMINQLQSQLGTEVNALSEEKTLLVTKLDKTERDLRLKNVVIEGLQAGVSTLNRLTESLRETLCGNAVELEALGNNLREADELLVVRKAEVDELNIELFQYKQEVMELKVLAETRDEKIHQLLNLIEDNNVLNQRSTEKIEELDLELQKQETDHIAELEAFHTEMSNVQAMVTNKSNDLFKMKESREQLLKDNELLKYELATVKEEAADYETRLSNLKAKLQESKTYNQELEAHFSQIKSERSNLELETDKRLQQLAEDLYIQYSKKHEQKVQALKKGYETKWSNKVSKAENESEKLRREIEGLKGQLENEKNEKNEIIKLWDQFKEAEASKEHHE